MSIDDTDQALFASATRVQVRNGRTASFWKSSWLIGASLASLFPTLHQHSHKKNRTVWGTLNDGNWIRDINQAFTADLITEYVHMWELVAEAGFLAQMTKKMMKLFGWGPRMEYTRHNLHTKFSLRGTLSQFFLPTYGAHGHHRGVCFSFGSCSKTRFGL
jgi:hypothetical protein